MTLVEFKNATKHFGEVIAFRDVSLAINPGEIIALVGPNGSGKTTLLRALVGLTKLDDSSGQTVLDTVPPIGIMARKQMLYIPDDDSLIDNITALEYFGLVANLYDMPEERIDQAVSCLRQLDFDLMRLNKTLRTYSHGMRKKVQLAAMAIPNVRLIIIDEPTNGLDPTATILLREQLTRIIAADTALLISTHNLAFAEAVAKRVVLMKNEVLYDGPLTKLLAESKPRSLEAAYARLVLERQ